MVDKFWNFFRGSAARWRARGRTRRARKDRPPAAAALAFEAERGPCDVRSRASRASTRARRGGPISVWVAQRCGMLRGSCAGTEWLSDDAPHVRPRTGAWAQTSAAHAHVRARAPGNTLGLVMLATRSGWQHA